MTDWNLTLFGPWGDDYSKNVKVTDIDGVPVHKVYDGFAGTDIESVDFSEASIKMIVSLFSSTTGTFEGCTKLKTVKLPDTVTQFYSQTFKNCTALEEINIPKSALHPLFEGQLVTAAVLQLMPAQQHLHLRGQPDALGLAHHRPPAERPGQAHLFAGRLPPGQAV